MVVNNVTLTAGSPSVTMTIKGQPRTFAEPFQLTVQDGDISYHVAPLLENYQKPGLPTTPEWAPNMNDRYTFLRLDKKIIVLKVKEKTERLPLKKLLN